MPPRGKPSPLAGIKLPVQKQPQPPLWEGPEGKGEQGGITFSLLNRFLSCRERFRVRVIEGLRSEEGFNHRIEYGNMWHICEEAWATDTGPDGLGTELILTALEKYARGLMKQYSLQQDDVLHWWNVCRVQFPVYVRYWSEHPDVTVRKPLLQEQVFDVPYHLSSGRVVRLRGKWDSVDLVGSGKNQGVWLQENKTKGDVDEIGLQTQLTFDLQTMLYLVALVCDKQTVTKDFFHQGQLCGVRYNVVRRPLSGGKGNIKPWKPTKKNPQGESMADFYQRLRGIIDGSGEDAPGPGYFFYRWNVDVTPQDVQRFRTECLDPLLETVCHWYDWVRSCYEKGTSPFLKTSLHWRHPFGCTNTIDEYGPSDVDNYINTGSMVGLKRAGTLFKELE